MAVSASYGQSPRLDLKQIMRGEEYIGSLPENIIWSEQSDAFYFTWKENEPGMKPYYKYDISLNAITELDALESFLEVPSNGVYTKDRKFKVWSKKGDLFLNDLEKGEITQITNTNSVESRPYFINNDTQMVFEMEGNLYARNLKNGNISQVTDFKKGKKKEEENDAMKQWLEKDQLNIFDVLMEREEKSANNKAYSKPLEKLKPKTIYTGEKTVSEMKLSPDGKYLYYQLLEKAKITQTDNLDYVTKSGFAEVLKSREKVGSERDNEELWVYQIEADTFFQFDVKSIPGIFEKPDFYKLYDKEGATKQFEIPRKILIHGPDIAENGNAMVEIRSQDNKDRWFMYLDPIKAQWKMVERQHDDAWIGGPGITGWNEVAGNKAWMPDEENYWFHSEESGFSHLYSVNVKTGKRSTLTKGEFEIHDAFLSSDKTHFYIVTNEEDPGERHLYKMDLDGKNKIKITNGEGNHETYLSPDEKLIVNKYSFSNKPWELYLMKNEPGAEMMQITESTSDDFNAYLWKNPELIYFKASDGKNVRARLYNPDLETKNGAAVIFVHGAGYLQNAHKWWSSYYREYMFHNLLVDMGYTVLDIDYRASEGYGRDWRTGIYRHMGGKDLSDHVDGTKYLVEEQGIDKERIGIYGGSYGGFITLMALFNESEYFACGAAIRSVTDWAQYNHEYTSNILNTPLEDSLAYKMSSPIYFVEGLNDPLLMLHGVVDTNVQYQDIIKLTQRLIELGKTNWELASYPVEPHGFKEASSWADEYRRILELFESTLRK